MRQGKESGKIIRQEPLAPEIFSMWVETQAAQTAVPGQFVSLFSEDESHLLPRPISICEIDRKRSALRLVYRVAGWGTKEFSKKRAGDTISLLGPLGNGFVPEGRRPVVIGGGIGIPPLLELSRQLKDRTEEKENDAAEQLTIVLGYRDDRLFLNREFEACGRVWIATDDGSVGVHGTVVDVMEENNLSGDVIYACGPKPMLAAVKAYAKKHGIKCYVSMEERMACGVGACLGCVCQTKGRNSHSGVHHARVCKDGPVFLAEEVELS